MKVVILAGGFGTRISEETDLVPKPMIKIGSKPILWHLMSHYAKYGYKEFILALGYKSEVVKEYFINYPAVNSDFTIEMNSGKLSIHSKENLDWKVTLVDTGLNTMTGGRLARLKEHLKDEENFMLTYGDGLSDVNIAELVEFHKQHKKLVTVTAVHPVARFGEMIIEDNVVKNFKEKPQIDQGWINGGFFVVNKKFLNYIKGDHTILEKEPLESVCNDNELMSFKHEGFWQCMDTLRDKKSLEKLWNEEKAPWKTW
tara:strand:+ start:431 stop:1201 length:771 start_codon:yes stop_codon:yes gene_type:complete